MSTSNEQLQRESDRQRGLYDQRQLDKARFADNLWEIGVDLMRAQAPLNTADQARLRGAAETTEIASEGRQHGQTRPQRHE